MSNEHENRDSVAIINDGIAKPFSPLAQRYLEMLQGEQAGNDLTAEQLGEILRFLKAKGVFDGKRPLNDATAAGLYRLMDALMDYGFTFGRTARDE